MKSQSKNDAHGTSHSADQKVSYLELISIPN